MDKPHDSLIFIGGSQRSGSTILQKLICTANECHPMIGECWFLLHQLSAYQNQINNYDVLLEDYFGRRENFDQFTRNILSRFFDETRKNLSNPHTLVMRHPGITTQFPILGSWFENARFIINIRDPRDTIASIVKVNEQHKREGVKSGQSRLGRDMNLLTQYFKRNYLNTFDINSPIRDRTLFVRYESLMKDVSKECAKIAGFCSLSFDDNKINSLGQVKTNTPHMNPDIRKKEHSGAAFWSDLYSEDLSTTRIGKHKEILTSNEILQIQMLCNDFNKVFPYW
ncbi:MAG: hypothetical protein ACI9H8_001521 [Lysobacterales bacterium]